MNLFDRAKNIIITPKTEWPVIAGEEPNIGQIIKGYVVPLALIPAMASIIGWGVIGSGITSFTLGLARGLVQLGVAIISVYVIAYVVDFLAPNFGSQKSLGRAVQLVAYSSTPGWVAGVLHIIPVLGLLVTLASLYGLYVMYLGLPYTMKTPQDKVIIYLVVVIVAVIVTYLIVGAILGAVFFGLFGITALATMGG